MTHPDASTRLLGVIGHPVAHSLSPAIHNAALRHEGVNAVYLALDVSPEDLGDAIRGLRAVDALGVNVTIPHKQAALAVADEAGLEASRTGAANTLVFHEGKVKAHNTDVRGFAAALREVVGEVADLRFVVLGAGGAARAALCALHDAGVVGVVVANRTTATARELADDMARSGIDMHVVDWQRAGEQAQAADVVVNTTSMGLTDDQTPLDPQALRAAAAGGCRGLIDLVYRPGETRLVREARACGIPATDGLHMLVYQAAAAFELFTRRPAPVEVMLDAAWSVTGRPRRPGIAADSVPPIV